MPTSTASPGRWPARVIIIDDHEISRAAFIALLRAEGIDVTAGPVSYTHLTLPTKA